MPQRPAKTCISLVEILAWLHINGICERGSQIHHLPKPPGYGEPEQDKILKTLRKRLRRRAAGDGSLEVYADIARGRISLWFVNVAHNPLASLANAGYQLISERVDALSFGAAHECLVANVEHLFTTTWGEVRIEAHPGGGEGLLNCLCRYLDLFAPHKQQPEPISAYSYSSTRGDAIAARVARLVQSVADAFHLHGHRLRYILRIADNFFQVEGRDDHFEWTPIGELDALERHLAKAASGFQPTRIDRLSMQGSPLPALMMRNVPDLVQVFYQVLDSGIQLYILDECGSVFQQWVAGADEYHLMVQQRRFLDAVASRRLLSSIQGVVDPGPTFARIARLNTGDWQVAAIKVPRTRVTDHTELTLAVGPGGDLQEGFRLQLGNREFDSLALGDALYSDVARHLKRLRRTGANYPVYLTGVISAEGDNGRPCGLIELLRMKQQVEQRLAEEMR